MVTNEVIRMLIVLFGMVILLFMLTMTIISIGENEKRAARISIILAIVVPSPYFNIGLFQFKGQNLAVKGSSPADI